MQEVIDDSNTMSPPWIQPPPTITHLWPAHESLSTRKTITPLAWFPKLITKQDWLICWLVLPRCRQQYLIICKLKPFTRDHWVRLFNSFNWNWLRKDKIFTHIENGFVELLWPSMNFCNSWQTNRNLSLLVHFIIRTRQNGNSLGLDLSWSMPGALIEHDCKARLDSEWEIPPQEPWSPSVCGLILLHSTTHKIKLPWKQIKWVQFIHWINAATTQQILT